MQVIYDIESYPNVFTLAARTIEGQRWTFEISDRCNDWSLLNVWVFRLTEMVGYNNVAYDYPVLHHILMSGPNITAFDIYNKSISIINAPNDEKFNHIIWDRDQIVPQIDLMKIHHFDNMAKATSLKMLEFNMRSENIQDLPYVPGTPLILEQIDPLIEYNHKDVDETTAFMIESKPQIDFRRTLSKKYGRNMMNHNDVKIGVDYFINELGREKCYNGAQPKQTPRAQIAFRDIIFPYVKFEQPGFIALLEWLKSRVIIDTKGGFTDIPADTLGPLRDHCDVKITKQKGEHAKNLHVWVEGFQYVFGTGGIHGSIERDAVHSSTTHQLIDVDVTSYYPSLAIANYLRPEHLGKDFCDVYSDIKSQRVKHKKGTPENAMLKLALNGVYGKTNSKYGPLYDPKYTMAITINGQLLLCMLAEQLIKIPTLRVIQINTDGITVLCPRSHLEHCRDVCRWWETVTKLDLEEALYSSMWIRDVNNYVALYPTGKLKRKGVYEWDVGWHQNHSALIIKKAVEAHMVYKVDIERFIREWPDVMDFMMVAKVPRSSRLVMEPGDQPLQHITRYYVSNSGGSLVKIMPPLPKKPEVYRRIGVNVGQKVTPCNDLRGFTVTDINYEYYINEAKKLVI